MKLQELALFGLTLRRIALFFTLSVVVALVEGLGMAMFLPVLEYVESDRDVSVLVAKGGYWVKIVDVCSALNLEVSFLVLLGIVLLLILLRTVLVYCRAVYSAWLTQDAIHLARTRLFNAYLQASYSYLSGKASGELINLVTIEAPRLVGYFTYLFLTFSQALVVIGLTGVLLWLSPPMTGMALIFLALAGLLVGFAVRESREKGRLLTEENQNFATFLVERLSALRLIKLTGTATREAQVVAGSSLQVRGANYVISKLNARVELLFEPAVTVCAVLILYVAIEILHMSLSQVGLFMLVLTRLQPITKTALQSRQKCLASANALVVVGEGLARANRAREEAGEGGLAFDSLRESIRFEGVSFQYAGASEPALKELDATLPAGLMTALVGPSGAGKSTFVDVMAKLRLPQQGQVLFDGRPLGEYTTDSLRHGMAFVSQESFLFNDTVRANLTFAAPGASDAEILEALRLARAEEFVRDLPEGLDTVLGERGARLSGGQRQRLALARALVQHSPILILDEPTSALDSEIEHDIQRAVFDLRDRRQVTIVVIAHRLSTIRAADNILVLEDGRLVEEGTHEELVQAQGWYARACSLQEV